MRLNSRAAAVGAVAVAILLGGSAVASATIGDSTATARKAASRPAPPRPCTVDDVSFHFGGYTAGLSKRSFDLTLLAHDGVVCTLTDTPLITLRSADEGKSVPVSVNGRGGTLVLRPDSPLHTTAIYNIPDSPEHTARVSAMTLAMPDRTSRSTYFYAPGVSEVYQAGVSFTSWTTGLGLGQGEEAF